ncbi:MAG: hypothetical protein R2848_14750 [Thermomicrobiales bacterium]
MRGSSADQPRPSDDPMYPQSSDAPPPRSSRSAGSSGGGDRPSSYQTEERYWTDYLRIALPIAGLLLLLSVFWYWASSFIGDDDSGTQTPVVAVNVTPQDQPTFTPTLADAIQLTPVNPTATSAVPAEPTQPPAQPTQAPAEPTQAQAEPTTATTTGAFNEGDLVVVNDNDVKCGADASTSAEIVDTLYLRARSSVFAEPQREAEGYTWWNVSDDALGASPVGLQGDFLGEVADSNRSCERTFNEPAERGPFSFPYSRMRFRRFGRHARHALYFQAVGSCRGLYLAGVRIQSGVPASNGGAGPGWR